MPNVEAKLKIKGKNFEILVDVEKAIQLKKGVPVSMDNVVVTREIFYNIKKGDKASGADLKLIFGTEDVNEISKRIVLNGEVQIPTEYKKKELDDVKKQVITFLSRNALDPASGRPHSEKRLSDALDQCGVKIENRPVEQQISGILAELKKILPVKIETKRLKILISAIHTGKVYGLLNEYKEKEEWLSNGDLSCVVNIPAGLQMEFYDKLNSITHGSSVVQEMEK